jgi:hypothetical protein
MSYKAITSNKRRRIVFDDRDQALGRAKMNIRQQPTSCSTNALQYFHPSCQLI